MLPMHFHVLTISGVWCPMHWSSKRRRTLYKLYSLLIIVLMYSLGCSQLARIIFVRQTFKDFNDTFFILLSTNFACFKAAFNLLNRRQVMNLINMFDEDCCVARDDIERVIQKRYNDSCRQIQVILLSLVELTALFVVFAPLCGGAQARDLPYQVLLPYGLSDPLLYWLTFLHHGLGALLFTAISITNDAMITGFMMQLCGQLSFVRHRLAEAPGSELGVPRSGDTKESRKSLERHWLAQIVHHHVHIIRIAETICSTFKDIVICQFCISALEICVSVYQLSVRTTNAVELLTYSLYLMCMLGQFFVYCYFGNEVTLQSKIISGAIFSIDWTSFSVELKKDLTMIILRSSKPIAMTCGPFVHLTLESFTHILKASYSAFSVLKSSA